CPRCGRSLPRADAACAACAAGDVPHALDTVLVACVYEGAARKAIIALKFGRQRRLAAPLGDLLATTLRSAGTRRVDGVVPVPLHAARLRQRGYNQAELLARRCAHQIGAPCLPGALVRARATPPQVGLSLEDRRRNVAGAFALGDWAHSEQLAGKHLVLVDDVTTTGSTLDAAARALQAAGPAAIIGLTVARPDLHDDGHTPHRSRP
ncbi:MAG: ComF family protein, partial [Ktedonobacterales bacterium]